MRRASLSVHRGSEHYCNARARGIDVEDRRGSDILLQAARAERRARGIDDRERLLSRGFQGAADGIRGGGAAVARHNAGRQRRLRSKRPHPHDMGIRNLRDRIHAVWHWLRSGPRTPGYPFTANWTLFSQAVYAIQTTFNQWFRARNK